MSPEKNIIGFIGLGVMGASMAGHLVKAGYRINVHTRTRAKAESLIGAARACDIVVNAWLPAAIAQGTLLKQPALVKAAEEIFVNHPPLESNAPVRFTAHRLFGRRMPPPEKASGIGARAMPPPPMP